MATRVLEGSGAPFRTKVRGFRLRVLAPERLEGVHEFAQAVLRVGSRQGNDLVLADDSMSRMHFEIRSDENGFKLRDLGSTNGTFVDDYRAFELYLRPNAKIGAGETRIVFEPLSREVRRVVSANERFGPLVGRSRVMLELFDALANVAATDFTILVEGESGTGKELIAEAIHRASERKGGPFVVFDCASVASSLLESELFGHQQGAFTGASGPRAGCLEEADGGTLFLDEIGELPLDLQPKLLRVLEKKEFRRLGSNTTESVDVRIVAATNRDLSSEVNVGTFRDDLYYRLAVVRLEVPPLRERREDIRLLTADLVRRALGEDAARAAELLDRISDDNWRRLESHPWRGNVRELRNAIERAIAFSGKTLPDRIEPSGPSRPVPILAPDATEVNEPARDDRDLVPLAVAIDLARQWPEQRSEILARAEREYLLGLLDRHDGNISRASSAAGIDRAYFKRLLRKYRP